MDILIYFSFDHLPIMTMQFDIDVINEYDDDDDDDAVFIFCLSATNAAFNK